MSVCVCVFVYCEKKLGVQGWEGVCRYHAPGVCLIKFYSVAWAYLTMHL